MRPHRPAPQRRRRWLIVALATAAVAALLPFVWNGNAGRTFFYRNELPYHQPDQAAWMNDATRGYAAYKVADSVTTHEAWGVGSYCNFNVNPSIVAERSFEVPTRSGVRFTNMVIVSLGGVGTIAHVIDNTSGPANTSNQVVYLTNYP